MLGGFLSTFYHHLETDGRVECPSASPDLRRDPTSNFPYLNSNVLGLYLYRFLLHLFLLPARRKYPISSSCWAVFFVVRRQVVGARWFHYGVAGSLLIFYFPFSYFNSQQLLKRKLYLFEYLSISLLSFSHLNGVNQYIFEYDRPYYLFWNTVKSFKIR